MCVEGTNIADVRALKPERREVRERPLLCSRCAGRVNRKYAGKIRVDPEFVKAYRRYKGLSESGRRKHLEETKAIMAEYAKIAWANRSPEERVAFIAKLHSGRDRHFAEARARREARKAAKLADEARDSKLNETSRTSDSEY